MKGLQLAADFFHEHGAPMIGEFPEFAGRIAAGLVGDGSECLGFDDEISRDHDWGPGFCLWLTAKDYEEIGQALQHRYDALPRFYKGHERHASKWGAGRVGVFETDAFYRSFIGRADAPQIPADWLRIPDAYFASCTSGTVFDDPLGSFSRVREGLLAYFPEDVRLVRIAARCMSAAQQGQYNFARCIRRREYFAAQYAETKFCADIMQIVYLLNRRYAPYYKWLHRGIRDLPVLGRRLFDDIGEMTKLTDPTRKQRLIEHISAAVVVQLHTEGLSDAESDFLLDHGPSVHSRIADETLRERDVWLG